jgi:hypothetical protein
MEFSVFYAALLGVILAMMASGPVTPINRDTEPGKSGSPKRITPPLIENFQIVICGHSAF